MKVNYQWHDAPKELPDCDCVCVTFFKGFYCLNVWNSHHQCWDYANGGEFFFGKDIELRWMALEVNENK